MAMSSLRDAVQRPLRFPSGGGIITLLLLIGSIALVACGDGAGPAATSDPAPATATESAGRFTLRLGEGFRFRDGVVVGDEADQPDIVFKYLPPKVGGLSTRY